MSSTGDRRRYAVIKVLRCWRGVTGVKAEEAFANTLRGAYA